MSFSGWDKADWTCPLNAGHGTASMDNVKGPADLVYVY
jgi:hypothetical protein